MTDAQVEKCRKRLQQFLADLLEPLGRSERKHWSEVYVRGLLLDGERKSIEPLADRVGGGNVQAMQQLVGQSPWDWIPVWERLAKRMTAELEPDSAWVVDDTGFPKQGEHSVGVERQYSGTLGKVGNCQVAVSVHHVGEQGHSILGWRLYLPESWTKDRQRRAEAGIPEDLVFQTKWQPFTPHLVKEPANGKSIKENSLSPLTVSNIVKGTGQKCWVALRRSSTLRRQLRSGEVEVHTSTHE